MSCNLTKDFGLGCKIYAGGVNQLKIKALPITNGDFTVGPNNIVSIAVASQTGWYTYNLRKEVSSLTQTATVNPQNATLFYNDELKFMIEGFTSENSKELDLLAKNYVLVAVESNAGNIYLIGLYKGADLITNVGQTGTAFGDRFGYEITINYKDTHPVYEITKATYDSLTQ